MTKKLNPERADRANPEWSAKDFAKAEPASDVLAELFGKAQAKEMLKPKRGRPKSTTPQEHEVFVEALSALTSAEGCPQV